MTPAPPPSPWVSAPVTLTAPLLWLAAGARDLRAAPLASLAYGAAFAVMGALLLFVFRHAYAYASAVVTGFVLVGPFLATGLYDLSRRRERGEPLRLRPTLTAWRANVGGFAIFALVLTVLMLVWARASLITFALFFASGMPTLERFVAQVLSPAHWDFVLTWCAVGLVFATLAFALSVVSMPLMLDRGTDAVSAALASVRVLAANPAPLALWAGLIVLLIGIGFATAMIGLVITAPWVGHATWHAYRALLPPAE